MLLKSDKVKSEGSSLRWTPFEGESSLLACGAWEIHVAGDVPECVGT